MLEFSVLVLLVRLLRGQGLEPARRCRMLSDCEKPEACISAVQMLRSVDGNVHWSFEDRKIYPIKNTGTRTGGNLLGRTVFTALTLLIKQDLRQWLRHVFERRRSRLSALSR